MTRLVLVRHAKAEVPRPGLDDHERTLTMDGRGAASALGAELAGMGVAIDVALVSSAVRTQQTWKLMEARFTAQTHIRDELYEANVSRMIAQIAAVDDADCIAVVGHEPTLSATAAWLAGPGSQTRALQRVALGLQTGTAALLDVDGPAAGLGPNGAVLTAVVATHARF